MQEQLANVQHWPDDAATALAAACRAGDMAGAYRIIRDYRPPELAQIALKAGFSCVHPGNRGRFLQHLQSQIAEAARQRVDGFGLRRSHP